MIAIAPDWRPLTDELSRWSDAGLTLPIWWRDDDASRATPELARLSALSRRVGLPVHLAVVPARAQADLAGIDDNLIPLIHGWAHLNHAPESARKAEFGAHRPLAAMLTDCRAGLDRLRDLFGARLCPVFVPPWNRIAPDLIARLPGLGFTALSTFTPRDRAFAAPGLARINTHLDPVDWRGTRGLADPALLIARITAQLADRRAGIADNAEPYGLLTHHLIHDDAIWGFTGDLLGRLSDGPTTIWRADRPLEPKGTTT